MANGNSSILTAEQEQKLRQPIDEYVGKIQSKIDGLRADGTDKVVTLQNRIDNTKRDRNLTKEEKRYCHCRIQKRTGNGKDSGSKKQR